MWLQVQPGTPTPLSGRGPAGRRPRLGASSVIRGALSVGRGFGLSSMILGANENDIGAPPTHTVPTALWHVLYARTATGTSAPIATARRARSSGSVCCRRWHVRNQGSCGAGESNGSRKSSTPTSVPQDLKNPGCFLAVGLTPLLKGGILELHSASSGWESSSSNCQLEHPPSSRCKEVLTSM